MSSNARMTFHFNSQKSSCFPARKLKLDKEDAEVKNLTNLNDIQALEKIIEKTHSKKKLHFPLDKQGQVGEFPLLLGEDLKENVSAEYPRINDGRSDPDVLPHFVPPSKPSIGRVLLSVFGAIGTGVFFGYLVLSLFAGSSFLPSSKQWEHNSSQAIANKGELNGNIGDKKDGVSSEHAISKDSIIRQQKYYLLQSGVYSSKEAMYTAAKKLRKKGGAAVTDLNAGYRVYIGIAHSKPQAEQLARKFLKSSFYVKTVSLPQPNGQEAKGLTSYLQARHQLVGQLMRITLSCLLQEQTKPLSETQFKKWQFAFDNWNKVIHRKEKNSVQTNTQIYKLNRAAQYMVAYGQRPNKQTLWNIQSSLIESFKENQN